jgi:hypothetical protein
MMAREHHNKLEVLTFLAPNTDRPHESESLGVLLTSVDRVEELTGLDFFRSVPDEKTLESRISELWKSNE